MRILFLGSRFCSLLVVRVADTPSRRNRRGRSIRLVGVPHHITAAPTLIPNRVKHGQGYAARKLIPFGRDRGRAKSCSIQSTPDWSTDPAAFANSNTLKAEAVDRLSAPLGCP